ncbi:hypothetical protein C7T94_08080 [Pedobacter yulinensis]|uniref:Uncharacterized protein n=2 Tax=Pedobacter yulinensis TaxID=2126353 RepID=A0A2T3HJJ8_9SPHI|nr:hypothetical protein C7T94_08080 [Pedobacter yulinensis]
MGFSLTTPAVTALAQSSKKHHDAALNTKYINIATASSVPADTEPAVTLALSLKGAMSDIIFSNSPVQLSLGKSALSHAAAGFTNDVYTVPVSGLYVIEGAFTISPGTFFNQHSGVIGIHLKTGNDKELVSNFVSGLYGPILGETWAGTSISLTGKAVVRLNAGTTIATWGSTYGAGSTTQMQVQFLSFQRIQ